MTRTTARRSGDTLGPHRLTAVAWELWDLAAAGQGMAMIGGRAYGSDDWHLNETVWHEAGHAAAARAIGCEAWITITSPRSGLCQRAHAGYLPPGADRSFALAGPVAGHMAKYGYHVRDEELQVCVHPSTLSDSDRILAGAFGIGDLAASAALLRRSWRSIEAESAQVLARELARWGAQSC